MFLLLHDLDLIFLNILILFIKALWFQDNKTTEYQLTKNRLCVNILSIPLFGGVVLTDKNRTLLCSVSSLALFTLGAYRIFTNNLEAMSILVAYIFLISGLISFVSSVAKLYRIDRT